MHRARLPAGPRALERPTRRDYGRFTILPVGVSLGALVVGIELGEDCDGGLHAALEAALADWKVLFFRDQHMDLEHQAALADRFGRLVDDTLVPRTAERLVDNVVVFTRDAETPGLENEWHSDGTFRTVPTRGTILRAIEVPEVGGDTLFADMAGAYDLLPAAQKRRIATLSAVHDWSIGAYAEKYGDRLPALRAAHPPVEHPVVVRHPETGRATLFVNRLFTRSIVGLTERESDGLLSELFAMADLPELQVRWVWTPGSVAFWDNLACNHYAASDYHPARRVMARTTFFSRSWTRVRGLEASA